MIVVLVPPLIVLNCKSVPDLTLNTWLPPPTLEALSILLPKAVLVSAVYVLNRVVSIKPLFKDDKSTL